MSEHWTGDESMGHMLAGPPLCLPCPLLIEAKNTGLHEIQTHRSDETVGFSGLEAVAAPRIRQCRWQETTFLELLTRNIELNQFQFVTQRRYQTLLARVLLYCAAHCPPCFAIPVIDHLVRRRFMISCS
jgi:hypothetical protein